MIQPRLNWHGQARDVAHLTLQAALSHLRCPIHGQGTEVTLDPDGSDDAPFRFSHCCEVFGEVIADELDVVLG